MALDADDIIIAPDHEVRPGGAVFAGYRLLLHRAILGDDGLPEIREMSGAILPAAFIPFRAVALDPASTYAQIDASMPAAWGTVWTLAKTRAAIGGRLPQLYAAFRGGMARVV